MTRVLTRLCVVASAALACQLLLASARPASAQVIGEPRLFIAHWGGGDDRPVPADYIGNRADDIAVFRPAEGNWYVLESFGPCQDTEL
jgi:hypothetical protein